MYVNNSSLLKRNTRYIINIIIKRKSTKSLKFKFQTQSYQLIKRNQIKKGFKIKYLTLPLLPF